MNENRIIEILKSGDLQWRRVRNLICVHAFYENNYYINLCKYISENNLFAISVNVDNVKTNENDIVDVIYNQGTSIYNILEPIYNMALKTSMQIDDVSNVA